MSNEVSLFRTEYINLIDAEDWEELLESTINPMYLNNDQVNELLQCLAEIDIDLDDFRKELLYNKILAYSTGAAGVNLSTAVFANKFPYLNTFGITLREFMSVLRAHKQKIHYEKNGQVIWDF